MEFEEPQKERRFATWWRYFKEHGDGFLARFLLALFAILDSVIIFFPPEIVISALTLAKPRKWWFYTLYTTFFTTVGAVITYVLGAFFFETFGAALLSLMDGSGAFVEAQKVFSENALWGILFVGVTPIPWVPFLLAAGVFKVNFFVFLLGVVGARLLRFGIIAFIVARYGQPGLILVSKILQIMGRTGLVITILALVSLGIFFVHVLF